MRHLVKCLICITVVYMLSPLHVDERGSPSASEPHSAHGAADPTATAARQMKDLAAAAASADAAARKIDWSQLASIGEAGATELSQLAASLVGHLLSAKKEGRPEGEPPAALAASGNR